MRDCFLCNMLVFSRWFVLGLWF